MFEFGIINWRKLDTSRFWVGLFFTLCHPIYAWKYDRNCYGSFLWRCNLFFTETLPSYTPFSKASRWLAHTLIINMLNTKYLDDFYCRKSGGYSYYYKSTGWFGHCVLYKIYYKPIKKKAVVIIPNGLNEDDILNNTEYEWGYAKPVKKKIVSVWCWRKKIAINLYKKIVAKYPKLYKGGYITCPEIANPWVMHIVDDLQKLLDNRKLTEEDHIIFDCQAIEDRFNSTKDNLERVWCYSLHLLTCPNDFYNHELLAWLFKECDMYLYFKMMKTRPEIDFTYRQTLEKLGEKEAKKWQRDQIKTYSKAEMTRRIQAKIDELRVFYYNQPFDYYRV